MTVDELFFAQHKSQFSLVMTVKGEIFYTAEQVSDFVEAENQLLALASH
ncbi:hypothetical protein [Pseudoalteromonas sp. Of11M-6]|nr:hypothetical protein [Pseudoalteromonas sp. Of11M-6]MCG7554708.1 hypothetical protein [Pseudoalteromonas sp. Of11M-6]